MGGGFIQGMQDILELTSCFLWVLACTPPQVLTFTFLSARVNLPRFCMGQ